MCDFRIVNKQSMNDKMNAQNELDHVDQMLIEGLKRLDSGAMETLYNNYYSVVYNKCLSFSKNSQDATDLAQDIFLKIFEKINTFSGRSMLSTWIYSVTFNYCTDHLRRKKYTMPHLAEWKESGVEVLTGEETEDHGWFEVAELCFLNLPKEDYDLLCLKYKEGKSLVDLQIIYGLTLSAVKMRLARAKDRACREMKNRMATAA